MLTPFCPPDPVLPPGPVAEPPGWWRDAVFYQIFVRSFADASTGPLAGDGIGDLQGLIDRLDYLNDGDPQTMDDLGITALWLMPINPSPSYHGYDVTDYFDVNPQYGDTGLMKRFVSEAHRRGIRVILDFVPNHASSEQTTGNTRRSNERIGKKGFEEKLGERRGRCTRQTRGESGAAGGPIGRDGR